ncbi:type I-E CRISPR-associated protein Cas6/Cse3/CasE [Streptomyces sp. NPDC017964]|uniref:type I-E CRISPR-associated protein Cas6/Cse3/CasE n=1 Tax=Streptomyces sp. NPDC017964 TaxID=3365022 RepID=UPI0037B13408
MVITVPECVSTLNGRTAVAEFWHSELTLSAAWSAGCEDAYLMHHTVREGLASGPDKERVLYRVERAPSDRWGVAGLPLRLLVRSLHKPNWDAWLAAEKLTRAVVHHERRTWHAGNRIRLEGAASPVVSRNCPAGGRRRRDPLRSTEECQEWMAERLTRAGFPCRPDAITVAPPIRTHQRGHLVVTRDFTVVADILQPDDLVALLTTGIGRNRAWGAGMFTAHPIT